MKLVDKYISPYIEAFAVEENICWMWVDSLRGIYKRDCEGNVMLYERFPFNDNVENRLFSSMEKIDDKLILIPCNTNYVTIFDTSTREFKCLIIDEDRTRTSFMASWKKDNIVYAFGFKTPAIIKIDVSNEAIEYINIRLKHDVREDVPYFRNSLIEEDNELFIPFYNYNAILKFDTDTNNYEVIELSEGDQGYGAICKYKEGFILAPRNLKDNLAYYNSTNGQVNVIIQDNCEEKTHLYTVGMLSINDKLKIFCTDSKSLRGAIYGEDAEIEQGMYTFARKRGCESYVYNKKNGILTVYDAHGTVKNSLDLNINERYIEIVERTNPVIEERYEDDLAVFVEGIIKG